MKTTRRNTSELRNIGGGPLRSAKTVKKVPFLCKDGPFFLETLYLHSDGSSAIFTYRGETGRYINGKWHAA